MVARSRTAVCDGALLSQTARMDSRSALARIKRNCLTPLNSKDGRPWWDVAIAPNDIDANLVIQGVAFLEKRGLLVRHPDFSNLIQVVERARKRVSLDNDADRRLRNV